MIGVEWERDVENFIFDDCEIVNREKVIIFLIKLYLILLGEGRIWIIIMWYDIVVFVGILMSVLVIVEFDYFIVRDIFFRVSV